MNKDFLLKPYFADAKALYALLSADLTRPNVFYEDDVKETNSNTQIISVNGTLLRNQSIFTKLGYAVSTEEIKTKIKAAITAGNDVILVINSGGGEVDGMSDLCEYIETNKEKITAFIKGYACSGALWIATSCKKVIAENTSIIGSLGVVTSVFDDEKYWESLGIYVKDIVSTISPNKRIDAKTKEGQNEIRKGLDDLANIFLSSVKRNRQHKCNDVVAALENGGIVTGLTALNRGIIDEINSYDEVINKIQGVKMGDAIKGSAEAVVEKTKEAVEKTLSAAQFSKESTATAKFRALADFRNLLSDKDFNAFRENENATAEDIKNHILEKQVQQSPSVAMLNPNVSFGEDLSKKHLASATEDAICIMAGLDVKDADNLAFKMANTHKIKPMLATMLGIDVLSSTDKFMSSMTTSDFPLLLKSAGNRIMAEKFQKAEVTYHKFVNKVAFPDFREYSQISRSSFSPDSWRPLSEGGEVTKTSVKENGTSAKLVSRGAAFQLTRQMLINDDLGAFTDILSDFAQSAHYMIDRHVYSFLEQRDEYKDYKLKDGKSLFDSSHANLSVANSVLDEAVLSKARVAMMRQKNEFGEPIYLTPKLLIVPAELVGDAGRLIKSGSATQDNKNSGVYNEFSNAYEILTSPQLLSTKNAYLSTNQAVNLGYLSENGGNPIIELKTNSSVDGIVYQGVLDVVIYDNGYQQIYKMNGEAK
ncbi:hypothetical protein YY92_08190 [Campylobacter fetus]|uniref:phage major capsid protein n=1 Tax=Campylobacter fetus TaxID=196 RepID=UPI0011C80574|nr:S49 family peptidase [Campylobacter fetus]EAJ1232632.1 hypothetical protein [Campylobacter fetus]EAK0414689.1 hypothetical protein [Campylobacter fetus]TXF09195.1 hypothetical protein FPD25_03415 [Campylobacter fetus subsp. fetus]